MGIFNNEYKIVVGVSTQQLIKGKYTELRDVSLDAILNNKNIAQSLSDVAVNGYRANVLKYHNYVSSNILNNGNTLPPITEEWFILRDAETDTVRTWVQRETKYFFMKDTELLAVFNEEKPTVTYFTKAFWANRRDYFKYVRDTYMPTRLGFDYASREVRNYPKEINLLGSVTKVLWPANSPSIQFEQDLPPELIFKVHLADGQIKDFAHTVINVSKWMDIGEFLCFEYEEDGLTKELCLDLTKPKYALLKEEAEKSYTSKLMYLPTVSIRKNFVNLNSTTKPELRTTKLALKMIGLDIDYLTDSIMSEEDGNNPDIIDDSFIGFGVNIRSTNQKCINYMYDFFNFEALRYRPRITRGEWDAIASGGVNIEGDIYINTKYNDIHLFGGDSTNNYRHRIRYRWSDRTLKAGKLTDVGNTLKEIVVRSDVNIGSFKVDDSSLYLRRQVSETHYIEIEIRGLQFVAETYPNSFAYYYLSEVNDDAKNHIYIPIVMGIASLYGTYEQGELFKEGLTLSVFAKDVVKIAWYLRTGFLDIIQVVMIVVSLGSLNVASNSLIALFKEMAIEGIKQIIIGKIFEIAIKELADVFGIKAVGIALALAATYGAYVSLGKNLKDVTDFLKLTQLASNGFNNVVQDDINDIIKKDTALMDEYKSLMSKIEEINNEFAAPVTDIYMRRFSFWFNPNETPDIFYDRLTHNPNMGVNSLETISTFVQLQLTLPKNNDFDVF